MIAIDDKNLEETDDSDDEEEDGTTKQTVQTDKSGKPIKSKTTREQTSKLLPNGRPRIGVGRNDRDKMTGSTSMGMKTVTSTTEGTKLPLLTNSKSPPSTSEMGVKSLGNAFKAKGRFNSAIDVVGDAQAETKTHQRGKLSGTQRHIERKRIKNRGSGQSRYNTIMPNSIHGDTLRHIEEQMLPTNIKNNPGTNDK